LILPFYCVDGVMESNYFNFTVHVINNNSQHGDCNRT
jgi:hypothetical protein